MARLERLLGAWQVAASDLELTVGLRGGAVWVDFGSPSGTICSDLNEFDGAFDDASGFSESAFSDRYLEYDRALFTETLDDWGWCGEGEPSAWYSGEAWTA